MISTVAALFQVADMLSRQIPLGRGLLLLILALCDAGLVQAQALLRYKFKEGDKLNYELINQSELTINGERGYVVKVQHDVFWRIKKVSTSGKATVAVRLDRVRFFSETPPGTKDSDGQLADGRIEYDSKGPKKFEGAAGKTAEAELKKLPRAGLEFEMTIDALGHISAPKDYPLQNWEAAFILADEPLTKGKTWRKDWSTDRSTESPGGTERSEIILTYDGSKGGLHTSSLTLGTTFEPKAAAVGDVPGAVVHIRSFQPLDDLYKLEVGGRVIPVGSEGLAGLRGEEIDT
jgi:hypothetical protein